MKTSLVFSSVAMFLIIFMVSDTFLLHVYSQTTSYSCNSNDINAILGNGQLKFDTSSLLCKPVWSAQDFILLYAQAGPSLWSFVLTAPNKNAYVAIGFSPDGNMVGSSAIVGWVADGGNSGISQYYLNGQSPSQVEFNKGDLNIVGNSSSIVTVSSRIYMGFQLTTELPETKVLYAIGRAGSIPVGPNNVLSEHSSKISTSLNYKTGQSKTVNRPYSNLRKSHGVINMLGWGILMPIGAIVARFCKQWDPLWFYVHVSIQSLGFIFGVAGVASGFVLEDKTNAEVDKHKVLGVFILICGCLQVMAFLARPDKDSKYRKYWNWYHYIVGRLLIVIAAINVFYGINLGKAGTSWNAGYAVVLVLLFILAVILQVRMLMKK